MLGRCTVYVAALLASAAAAHGLEGPSAGLGKSLFHSTALGSIDKSCATCHPGGRGLQEIDAYDDPQLRDIVNACIRDALHGRLLSPDSQELESLVLYLRSLRRQ